jgi:hypothetical protein
MRKLQKEEMEYINGGMKCIYHGIALTLGIVFAPFNTAPLAECLSNNHQE